MNYNAIIDTGCTFKRLKYGCKYTKKGAQALFLHTFFIRIKQLNVSFPEHYFLTIEHPRQSPHGQSGINNVGN